MRCGSRPHPGPSRLRPILPSPGDTRSPDDPEPSIPAPPALNIRLVVAIAALAFPLGVLANHQFSDVPTGASYHDDVEALVNAGVTTGCGGGEYCPTDSVTRGQMAQFLNRLGNLDGNSAPSVDADELDGLDSTAFHRPLSPS